MIYIRAIRNDGCDPFNMKAKDMHITIKCDSLIAAMHVFWIVTGDTKYSEVTMSSSEGGHVDTNLYDVDVMSSDEFLLSEL